MIGSRYIDRICIGAAVLAAVLTVFLTAAAGAGLLETDGADYEERLFEEGYVHRVDIRIEDWGGFLERAPEEAYTSCTAVIDGETFEQVGIRAKGNNSLRLTEEYGLCRYSLKLEFDHFLEGGNYHGLDKFSLDASFQDNRYMKTWMVYDMMRYMEVPAPLCSYVWVTVNGEDWGLFLAIEEPEEAFARRNFGTGHGQLYKPDYVSLQAENADVALKYIDEDPDSYPGIFENAKFKTTKADKERLLEALEILDSGEGLERAVDTDEVLRYFAVQVFVMNWDSYLGRTGHNYFLYEEDGILQILPWDYNLAFGTYALGMTDPIKDPDVLINHPVNTPAEWEVMQDRPLYHNLMEHDVYFRQYREYLDAFVSGYFEDGRFEARLRETERMLAPYVEKDPTAFCTYEDFRLAVDTLEQVCRLRARSVRGQMEGEIPATIRGQSEKPDAKVDASEVRLEDLGDFEDLEQAGERQRAAAEQIVRK